MLEGGVAVLRKLVSRHTVPVGENKCPEGRPERNYVLGTRPFGGVNELLKGLEESYLGGTDPVSDCEEELRNDGAGDVHFVARVRAGGHFAITPAAEKLENCDSTIEHFIHGYIALFRAVALHEFAK